MYDYKNPRWGIHRIRPDGQGSEVFDYGNDEAGARDRALYLNSRSTSGRPVCYVVRRARGGRWILADPPEQVRTAERKKMVMKREARRLLDYAAIAELTGVDVATLRMWAARGKVPDPDFRVASSPAWLPETIAEWRNTFENGVPPRRRKAV